MAKKKGLGGAGLEALISSAHKQYNTENDSSQTDSAADSVETIDVDVDVTPNTALLGKGDAVKENPVNLPKGVEMDSNGQLFVDPELLKPNPYQPRTEFDEEKLNELAESVKIDGILQPVTIEDAEDGTFYIIAGERRTRAAKIAGLTKVPVQLKKYNDEKKLELALIENIQRENLNAIEEAKAYDQLMKMSGLTQEDVAKRVGKGRPTVANALRLLKLSKEMQDALVEEKISAGHARALLSVEDKDKRNQLFEKIIRENLSVREAEKFAGLLNNGGSLDDKGGSSSGKKDAPVRDPNFVDLEQQFIDSLGTRVVMKGDFNKGSIQIDYFSRADLDKLYTLITGKEA